MKMSGVASAVKVDNEEVLANGAEEQVQPRETLLRDVWGYEPTLDTRTVDTTMQRLRSKLGQAADCVQTVHGVGYRLIASNE